MEKVAWFLIGSIVIGILSAPNTVLSTEFGKNKINDLPTTWSYIQTEHTTIYFSDGCLGLAEFAAQAAEEAIKVIQTDLNSTLISIQRIPIILYPSHNAFAETNVILERLNEGVGGFTEFAKGRIVIPYEGSYRHFRHVLHHELTHAVMMEFLTGGIGPPFMPGGSGIPLPPLWMSEGFAEYESLGWDIEADAFMRDAVINSSLPPIQQLDHGFFAYKGGQALFRFIASEYGRTKIADLFHAFAATRSLDRAVSSVFEITLEEINDRWQKALKKEYWPEIAGREAPDEIAQPLTFHKKDDSFLNLAPAISPGGDSVAFLTDHRGTADIDLLPLSDIKNSRHRLIEGERQSGVESLLRLRPGIAWSPDGKQIAFTARKGGRNFLYLLDVERRRIVRHLRFNLDAIFTPAWSPDGTTIAMVGLKDGRSDLYLVRVNDSSLRQLTTDLYAEEDPSWSPDGTQIAFASDRPDSDGVAAPRYGPYRIDIMRVDGTGRQRITTGPGDDRSPVWSPDGQTLLFVSDRTGIGNLYSVSLDNTNAVPLTDLLTGLRTPALSYDGKHLIFSAFSDGGYDLYLLKDPFSRTKTPKVVTLTPFTRSKDRPVLFPSHGTRSDSHGESMTVAQTGSSLTVKPYNLKFSTEVLSVNAGFSTFYGLNGLTVLSISDLLGNHRFLFAGGLNASIRNSDLFLSYLYLPKKTDYNLALFHTRSLFSTTSRTFADRWYGSILSIAHPFSTFRRFEGEATFLTIERALVELARTSVIGSSGISGWRIQDIENGLIERRRTIVFDLGFVTDTALYGFFGPIDGTRSRIGLRYSPIGLHFVSLSADVRRYYRLIQAYTFALRITGGTSFGRHSQRFFLGGVTSTLNPRYVTDDSTNSLRSDEIFFASFEGPLRGADLYEQAGNSFLLVNTEFRFPLVRYLLLGWPLPLLFQQIEGVLFADLGGAFNRKTFRPVEWDTGVIRLKNLIAGYGVGVRLNLGIFILRFDEAWRTNLSSTGPRRSYISIGRNF